MRPRDWSLVLPVSALQVSNTALSLRNSAHQPSASPLRFLSLPCSFSDVLAQIRRLCAQLRRVACYTPKLSFYPAMSAVCTGCTQHLPHDSPLYTNTLPASTPIHGEGSASKRAPSQALIAGLFHSDAASRVPSPPPTSATAELAVPTLSYPIDHRRDGHACTIGGPACAFSEQCMRIAASSHHTITFPLHPRVRVLGAAQYGHPVPSACEVDSASSSAPTPPRCNYHL
jgi:hypothetical protein